MKGINMQEKIWVKSKTGKAVHLIDRSVVKDGKYQQVDISTKMAEAGIPIEVQRSDFILSYCNGSDAILEIVLNSEEAKKLYKDYFGVVSEADMLRKQEEEKQKMVKEAALKAALDKFEEAQKEGQELISPQKPRIRKAKKKNS